MKIWQLALGETKNNYPQLCTCLAYGEVAFVTLKTTYDCHWIYPLCVFVFEAEHIDRWFPSNCLFIQALIPSVCFLKLFVYTCQVSCSNTAVVCVDSARWRLPPRSTTSCSTGSSSAPCTFLIQHLWAVSWPASPGTWMRVRLDLSWLGTFPPQESSQSVKSPCLTRCQDTVFTLSILPSKWLTVIHFTDVFAWCGVFFFLVGFVSKHNISADPVMSFV